ncbi:MAG: BTAD domain-containing putative transcriptional regulator [Thermomicrobiales bacterium]
MRGGILALDAAGPVGVDVDAFVAAAEQAHRTGEPADYRAAIDAYGGELLPEDRYEDWVVARREELRETYHGLLLTLADRQRDDGDLTAAIATLQRLVTDDPAHEEAHIGLMRLQARLGQRARAIRQFQALRAALERDLDAEPGPEARRLYGDIVTGRVGQDRAERAREARGATASVAVSPAPAPELPSSLPVALTSLIGRELEVAAVHGLLLGDEQSQGAASAVPRLVTLIGIGGTGKTRLALAVARDVAAAYQAGPWFVDLAPLRDPALVPGQIASAIGVQERQGQAPLATIVAALRERRALLILDNCEHLIDAAVEVVERLLSGCAQLQILATSREALRLAGEVAWPVPPLDLPPAPVSDAEPPAPAQVERVAAVRLFVERVRQRQPNFALTPRNTPAVVAICRRLDGLPLALELAAARTTILTVEQIAARLDDALGLLVTRERLPTARQQTLRATLDWSYGLLEPPEQRLLNRLAIFDGGATLAAIEAVAGEAGADLLDGLAVLANQSLVQRHDSGDAEPRFRLLELVREYGRAQLVARDELEASRARHAAYYLAFAEEAERGLAGAEQLVWVPRLTAEVDNLRAALRWAVETRSTEFGMRLSSALNTFWATRGVYREGRAWLDAFLAPTALDEQGAVPPTLLAGTLYAATMLNWRGGAYAAAQDYAGRGLALYRSLGERQQCARILRILANMALIEERNDAARAMLDEAEAIVRDGGDRNDLARVLNTQGELARSVLGDYPLAERYYREALAIGRLGGGTQESLATFLSNLGTAVLRQGDVAEGLRLSRESLELRLKLGHRRGLAGCLDFAGAAAIVLGRFGEAARFLGAAERLREVINSPRNSDPADEVEHQHYLAIARERADPVAWAADWAAGRAELLDAVIAEAGALA